MTPEEVLAGRTLFCELIGIVAKSDDVEKEFIHYKGDTSIVCLSTNPWQYKATVATVTIVMLNDSRNAGIMVVSGWMV